MSIHSRCFMVAGLLLCTVCCLGQEIKVGNHVVMSAADFGLETNMRSWSKGVRVVQECRHKVSESYEMLTGKRRHCHNEGMEYGYSLLNPEGDTLQLVIRKYKDGYAFRYVLPHVKAGECLQKELSRYSFPAESNRWMQQYDGPGYEHFFPLCPGGISPEGENITLWGYPALMELGGNGAQKDYVLLTETDVLRGHCGSLLENSKANRNTYGIHLFDESLPLRASNDGSWTSPWRILICGSLSQIVESTLVTDVATPALHPQMGDVSALSSWVYWANNHGSQEYSILKDYVDLAAEMHWPYTLIDAEWDRMRGGTIEDIVKYAVDRGVKPMIWYNSTTNWTGQWAPSPQGIVNDPDKRETEFRKIASWGVKGVKIDFFRDDKAETIDYYIDLLESAARNGLLVNFHGGTIPRGWQRTFPNFISAESVYGAEWYNNNGILTNKAARHNATLPFTRNVIGFMDYTPGTFTDSQHPHITTHAHELALTMLFESGIQHMPDRPSAYRELPEAVRELLMALPSAWDDTVLLEGYPGESVVIARRKGEHWYIAGINGLDSEQTIAFSTKRLGKLKGTALIVSDGEKPREFDIKHGFVEKQMSIPCQSRGGFVIVL